MAFETVMMIIRATRNKSTLQMSNWGVSRRAWTVEQALGLEPEDLSSDLLMPPVALETGADNLKFLCLTGKLQSWLANSKS